MKVWMLLVAIVAVFIIAIALNRYGAPLQQQPLAPVVSTAAPAEIIPGVPNSEYTSNALRFRLRYPSIASSSPVDFESYVPLTETPVASFTLPRSMFAGTNLGEAGVYIGATTSPSILTMCLSPQKDLGETLVGTSTINGTAFMEATSTGVGAGNIYQETVYRTLRNGACLELVELLHSGNIHNYPQGAVQQFNQAKYETILEGIVHTFQAF